MKRFTDDELTEKLEALSLSFQPTVEQKEMMYRKVFKKKKVRSKTRKVHWKPAIISFILLVSIVTILMNIMNQSGTLNLGIFAKDVTSSWEGIIMEQESSNDLTSYTLYFNGDTMTIQNMTFGLPYVGADMSEQEVEEASAAYQSKLAKMKLQAGEYKNYTVKKKKDTYTFTVLGKKGFTYTVKKIAPRKYMGEDGIRFSVNNYVE